MTSRRIFAATALLCALITPAHAQKTRAQLNTEIDTGFPDNNAPQILRNVTNDIVNSIMPNAAVVSGHLACFNGTTGLLQDCGSSPAAPPFVIGAPVIGASSTSLTQGTASGNTTKFATISGALTPGQCMHSDASGNLTIFGSECGASANAPNFQTFSAPGTVTTLTLTNTPLPTSAGLVTIIRDGVTLSRNTWSLNVGTGVIAFAAALPANVQMVEVDWYAPSTLAGVGNLTAGGNTLSGAVTVNGAAPIKVTANTGSETLTIGPVQYLYFQPEQFGGVCDSGAFDNTAAVQAAITAARSVPSLFEGVVQGGPCDYRVRNGGVNGANALVDTYGVWFVGTSPEGTNFLFDPVQDGTALLVSNGASGIYHGGMTNWGFLSGDGAHTKKALVIVDTIGDYVLNNVTIGGTVVHNGSQYWSGGTGSTGLQLMGRNFYNSNNLRIYADIPFNISQNPNAAIDLDVSNFKDSEFNGWNNPCIVVDPGVRLTRVAFTGITHCGPGTHGFFFNGSLGGTNTTASASSGATSIQSANVNYILPNHLLGITLASGLVQNVSVTSLAGTTVNFIPALAGNVNNGATLHAGGNVSDGPLTFESFYTEQVTNTGASFTASATGTTLNVSSVSSGTIAVGQVVTAAGYSNIITGLGTGTGGIGSYLMEFGSSVGNEPMTAAYSSMFIWPTGSLRGVTLGASVLDPARRGILVRNITNVQIGTTTCSSPFDCINADGSVANLSWNGLYAAANNTLTGQSFISFDPPQSGSFEPNYARLTNSSGAMGTTPRSWANNQACTPGQFTVDSGFIYVCTAANVVKRTTLNTF
jgi:hypothetical protein